MPDLKYFSKKLLAWYKKNKRDLPWRKTQNPYFIWISEIMLQQTTVNTVILYYQRWIKVLPTVQDVAMARQQRLLKLWQGLGYYNRVKNIHKAAKLVCTKYNGRIPRDPQELIKLPGFGPYTIGAVLSIAYQQSHPLIDANVRRVIMRILAIEEKPNRLTDQQICTFLKPILPKKKSR